jgi:hypothetical protein
MLALPCDKKSSVLNQAFLNTSFQSPNVIRWPDAPCNIVFNGVESKTGQYKIATKSEFLFDYTNSKLRKLYKEKSFMETKASFVALNNKLYLVLNIRIHSKDAPLTYGQISSGSTLKLIFMNGNEKYIKCSSTAAGQLRLQKKKYNTDYEVFYRLEKESIDMISKLDLDKIGIMWSSGFEEYEIYYLDLLKNQINCILNS